MPSKALQIRDAIVSLLRAAPVAGVPAARVFLDEVSAVEHHDAAAIFVEMGDEPAPEFLVGATVRALEVEIGIAAVGADAAAGADPVVCAVNELVLGNTTLSDLFWRVTEGPRRRERHDLDRRITIVRCLYRIEYRTHGRSLET